MPDLKNKTPLTKLEVLGQIPNLELILRDKAELDDNLRGKIASMVDVFRAAADAGIFELLDLKTLTLDGDGKIVDDAAAATVIGRINDANLGSTFVADSTLAFEKITPATGPAYWQLTKGAGDFVLGGLNAVKITENNVNTPTPSKESFLTVDVSHKPLAQTAGDPWQPTVDPTFLNYMWAQDYVADGEVTGINAAGMFSLISNGERRADMILKGQPKPGLAITKLPNNGGINFPQRITQHLGTTEGLGGVPNAIKTFGMVLKFHKNQLEQGRVLSFDETTFLRINGGKTGEGQGLVVRHDRDAGGLLIMPLGSKVNGVAFRRELIIPDGSYPDDGSAFEILVSFSQGTFRGYCNGQPIDIAKSNKLFNYSHREQRDSDDKSATSHTMGDSANLEQHAWTCDCFFIGGYEFSKQQLEALHGWMVRRPFVNGDVTLHAGHRYENAAPTISDAEAAWRNAWQHNIADHEAFMTLLQDNRGTSGVGPTWINTGGPAVYDGTGYESVFFDDFKADRLYDSNQSYLISDEPFNKYYGAPGWNKSIVGNDAKWTPLTGDGQSPDVYKYNAVTETLDIGCVYYNTNNEHKYACGVLMSTDIGGSYAHVFDGYRRYEYAFEFPNKNWVENNGAGNELAARYFPAIWWYGLDQRLDPSMPRIEIDMTEPHGNDTRFGNIMSYFVHSPLHTGPDALGYHAHHDTNGLNRNEKLFSNRMDDTRLPVNVNWWDGQKHEMAVTVDEATGFVYTDYRNPDTIALPANETNDGWIELGRHPVQNVNLAYLYNIFNTSLKNSGTFPHQVDAIDLGTLDPQNLTVDEDRILNDYLRMHRAWCGYRPARMAATPPGFDAVPTISGTAQIGQTLTCTHNLTGDVDVVVYNWIDERGLLLGSTKSPDFVIPATDANGDTTVGRQLRCRAQTTESEFYRFTQGHTALTAAVVAA